MLNKVSYMKGDDSLINSNVDQLMRRTFLYSYIISQPFTVYVDAYPIIENKLLLESKHLQFGHHSESVRILQKKLKKLNYYHETEDGKYGIITEYALKKFQAEHGITITGQADQDTITLVLKAELDKQLEMLDSLPEKVDPTFDKESITLIQGVLYYFGYYTGEIDGLYGPLTKQAVALADENHGLNLKEKLSKEPLKQLITQAKEELPPVETEKPKAESENPIKVVNSTENLIQTARSLIGSPYNWGGTSPNGFDCSGFIQYIYQEQKITIPRTVTDIWNFSTPIDQPSIGDLIFFETYKAGPSHLGIYIGNNQFIHAGLSNGVEIADLNQQYWRSRYLGAKRIQ